MADVFSKTKRSEVMSRIRGRGNKDTEVALAKVFRRHKINGWRRNQKVFGKPDFIFPKLRLAVFVDGCFWHGCPKHGHKPKGNAAFWKNKFARNIARDRPTYDTEAKAALAVIEHELAKSDWIVGKKPTIADVGIYAVVRYAPEAMIDLTPYPNIVAWKKRIEAMPGFGTPEQILPMESRLL